MWSRRLGVGASRSEGVASGWLAPCRLDQVRDLEGCRQQFSEFREVFIMFTMRDVLVEEQRRLDRMNRSEYNRFVHEATPVSKFKCLLCTRLGNALMRAGRRLQTRYAMPGYHTIASDDYRKVKRVLQS